MRFTVLFFIVLAFAATAEARRGGGSGIKNYGSGRSYKSHSVKPHVRRDGTYVAPSRRTNPDSTRMNNYGTRGNYNPYTGKEGTKDPYSGN